jgi:UDP-2-acetamido-3-amino-2,3-dideoxy-glucuronate N-acetyltransferase
MKNPLVHETAIVEEGFVLGDRTRVWHFSHLMDGSRIGSDCIIGQNVFIDKNVTIGNGVKIQNNVSIYNGVTIEDDVFIGPSVVFTNVINPRSFIDRKNEFQPTLVKRGATIGANATIICGVEIGSYAMIGAGSVVTKAVKTFELVYGNPAVLRGWVSKNGYRLIFNEKGESVCKSTGEKYRLKDEEVTIL